MSGGRLSGRGGVVDAPCSDRSLPVTLDTWDGWKAVGDIWVDFKTIKTSNSMHTSAN